MSQKLQALPYLCHRGTDELAKAQRGEAALDSTEQLSFIAQKLSDIAASLDDDVTGSRIPVPGLWRIVTDRWPYQNRLGQQIVEAELAYERLSRRE